MKTIRKITEKISNYLTPKQHDFLTENDSDFLDKKVNERYRFILTNFVLFLAAVLVIRIGVSFSGFSFFLAPLTNFIIVMLAAITSVAIFFVNRTNYYNALRKEKNAFYSEQE